MPSGIPGDPDESGAAVARGVVRRLNKDNDTKLGRVISVGDDLWGLGERAREWYLNKTRWSVSIGQDDRLYDAVLRWFLDSSTDEKPPRAVKAVLNSGRSSGGRLASLDDLPSLGSRRGQAARERPTVNVMYDENGTRELAIEGHKVQITLTKPSKRRDGVEGGRYMPVEPDSINFNARSRDGQQTVLRLLQSIADSSEHRKPALHLLTSWGDFARRDDLPERSLSSVVLRAGQMELLRDDLQRFLDDESHYTRRGLPYHRGYLLHGPPGTGKTSIVRALAAHFQLDLWYAPLGDLEKDTSLIGMVNQVRAGSILLLEDIDVYHAARERDDTEKGASMAALLNALDGVATPHGLITFLTSNDASVLDEALVRPGRIDVRQEIGYPDQDQIARLWENWYELTMDPEDRKLITFSGSTSGVTEMFKQNLNDATAALTALQTVDAGAEERSVTETVKGVNDERRVEREGAGDSGTIGERRVVRAA